MDIGHAPHADHFSAAGYLKDRTGVPTAIGEKVVDVQKLWQGIYNIEGCCPADGSQWNRLFADGERFRMGNKDVEVMFTPGTRSAPIGPDFRIATVGTKVPFNKGPRPLDLL